MDYHSQLQQQPHLHHQHHLAAASSSSSPPFSFSSPSAAFFQSGFGISPSASSHTFLPPSSSALPSSTSASFFDSSPLLPRRSPRLSSRVPSSFSPSPSLLTRSLSPSSSKRRRDSSIGLFDPPPPSSSFDEPWTSVFTQQVAQSSASSRSTPLTSREGKPRDGKGGSDRMAERSLVGDGDGRYAHTHTHTHMPHVDDGRDAPEPRAAQHTAKYARMQQQLLRAASGDYGGVMKREEGEDRDAGASSSPSPAYPAPGSGFGEERFPASSSSSATSTSSYPSLSSLSSAVTASPSALTPLSGPEGAVSSLALHSPTHSQTGRTSPSSPTFRPGESCHQCKTRRLVPDLIFCSARHLKKGRARKKKKERACRKKYCARSECSPSPSPSHPPFPLLSHALSCWLSPCAQVLVEVLRRGRAGGGRAVGVPWLQGHLLVRCV